MMGDVIYPLNAMLFGPGVHKVVLELYQFGVPLSGLIVFGMPCHHKTCFLRPKVMFLVMEWGKGYVSSHLVVSSIIVSMCCLSERV